MDQEKTESVFTSQTLSLKEVPVLPGTLVNNCNPRQRQESFKFKASQSKLERPCPKMKTAPDGAQRTACLACVRSWVPSPALQKHKQQ